MQNKPHFFFWKQGFPKGGEGGGSDTWEKFPKNPVFVFLGASLRWFMSRMIMIMMAMIFIMTLVRIIMMTVEKMTGMMMMMMMMMMVMMMMMITTLI